MNERQRPQVASIFSVALVAGLIGFSLTSSKMFDGMQASQTQAQRTAAGAVQAPAEDAAPQILGRPVAKVQQANVVPKLGMDLRLDDYYDQIRENMRWLPVRYAGNMLKTPDAQSRLMLSQAAARRAELHEVGLNYRDVYGIINAETSWIPRMGASKNGTPNLGIAQFEPATARAVGLKNPHDPVEAVHAMAEHLKDAANWSAKRIAGLELTPEQRAQKLREGVSIYYNLSTKGRNKWNGKNTTKLPIETQRHIANARRGAREAAELEAQLRQLKDRMGGEREMVATNGRDS